MSEHFQPETVARMPVSRRERRGMPGAFAQRSWRHLVSGRTVAVVIAAAVCVGVAVRLSAGEPQPARRPAPDKPIARGGTPPEASAATAPALAGEGNIPFFGYCEYGGGSNCVVDGDTFYFGRDKVLIAGIDAPETHPPRCAAEAKAGEAATHRLRDLLNAGEISLSSIDRDRDITGRKLRNVAVDGADVGAVLVGEGLARHSGSGRRSWCGSDVGSG